jgi:hypothetical protein
LIISKKDRRILIRPPVASAVGEGQQRYVNGASTANRVGNTVGYADKLDNGLYFNVTTNFGATKKNY